MFEVQSNNLKIFITLNAKLHYIDKVCNEVNYFLQSNTLLSNFFDINLIIREALSNAIIHGSYLDKSKKINLKLSLNHEFLEIEIEDSGPGWNWKKTKDVPDETQTTGRGWHIMKIYTDELIFNGKGNKLKMIKKIG